MAVKETITQLGQNLKRYTEESIIAHKHIDTGLMLNTVLPMVTETEEETTVLLTMQHYWVFVNHHSGFQIEAVQRLQPEIEPSLQLAVKHELESFIKQNLK